jgi:flagellar hook-associated protein 3 FlgL
MVTTTNEILFRLDNLNQEQQRISYQSSSKKILQNGSDDSKLFARTTYIEDKMQVFSSIQSQIQKSDAQNNVSDKNMAAIKDKLIYIKQELIKARTDTTDAAARDAIATDLEGVKQNIFTLLNQEIEGEYVFAGSNSTVKPFEMDPYGKVTYVGDSYVRKVAVEENEYRDRGITGFEAIMYNTDKAFNGDKLKFSTDERIIDQEGNEWKITITNSPATGDGQLVKYDVEGNPTSDTLAFIQTDAATDTEPAQFELTDPLSTPGQVLEAKHNFFDDLDKIINALRGKDAIGNNVTEGEALDLLGDQLDNAQSAFEAANLGHARLGGRNRVLDTALERVDAKLTQFELLHLDISGADLTKLAIESKALELTYTSMYSTINKMNQLSLVNFLS